MAWSNLAVKREEHSEDEAMPEPELVQPVDLSSLKRPEGPEHDEDETGLAGKEVTREIVELYDGLGDVPLIKAALRVGVRICPGSG